MPANNHHYLIISQSGRALAESARRANVQVHVIDNFADDDTVELALTNHLIKNFNDAACLDELMSLIEDYAKKYSDLRIVLGSGFENHSSFHKDMEDNYFVIANSAETVKRIKDPDIFFKVLAEFGLPFPDYYTVDYLQENLPEQVEGDFLIKEVGGSGGSHIRVYNNESDGGEYLSQKSYLQKTIQGDSYSATFLAFSDDVEVLGFNEIWTNKENKNFTFSGAATCVSLPDDIEEKIHVAIKQLVANFGLSGLCSLDFILDKSGAYFIFELNPRPTSTFELYEQNGSLFQHHVDAVLKGVNCKEKGIVDFQAQQSKAMGVLYAEKQFTMPCVAWPDWATDRTAEGTKISEGQPICSIHAEESYDAQTGISVREKLMERLNNQKQLFESFC